MFLHGCVGLPGMLTKYYTLTDLDKLPMLTLLPGHAYGGDHAFGEPATNPFAIKVWRLAEDITDPWKRACGFIFEVLQAGKAAIQTESATYCRTMSRTGVSDDLAEIARSRARRKSGRASKLRWNLGQQ